MLTVFGFMVTLSFSKRWLGDRKETEPFLMNAIRRRLGSAEPAGVVVSGCGFKLPGIAVMVFA